MIWPLDIELHEGHLYEGALYGVPLSMRREGPTLLVSYDEEEWIVGIPARTTFLRLGPALGPNPFLIFPIPVLVVPSGESLSRTFHIPLHLDLAALGEAPVRLREIRPAVLTRSLYGPVDGGDVCWTVKRFEASEAELVLGEHHEPLAAAVDVTIQNKTAFTHEVSKIMVPIDMIGLYDRSGSMYLSDVWMTLVSDHTAELTIESPAQAKVMSSVLGLPMRPARRSFALSHSYRNKTGLEYGF